MWWNMLPLAVDQRPAQGGTVLCEQVDGLGNEVGAERIGAAQAQEPCFHVGCNLTCHTLPL
jgi:hypothetical protein